MANCDVPLLYDNRLNLNIAHTRFENGLEIFYTEDLDGGGNKQFTDFLDCLRIFNKRYNHCLEWCAGHGAIGFSILDANFCEQLTLVEKYLPAMFVNKVNIAHNRLEKVEHYCSDSVKNLPNNLQFDLVVANPPHSSIRHNPLDTVDNIHNDRICFDINWESHKDFFNNIINYLAHNADILLSQIMFREEHIVFAEQAGLIFIDAYKAAALASQGSPNSCIMHFKYLKK